MHKANTLSLHAALLASVVMLSPVALAADVVAAKVSVAGEKLDSGLARLPHFGQWVDNRGTILLGQSLDSGLGELPHYSRWIDNRGNTLAGQSLDDGLGDLPHYSKWADATGKYPMARTPLAFGAHESGQAVLVSRRK